MKLIALLSLIGFVAAAPLLEERAINEDGCGKVKVPQTRIVGGTTAQKGQYPWLASMMFKSSTAGYKHSCGGAIINDQWVLTAAHCFFDGDTPSMFKIRVGTFNVSAGANEPEAQELMIDQYFRHEKYIPKSSDKGNDIALIKLQGKIDFTSPYVNRVCLPHSELNTDYQPLFVAGWGNTVSGKDNNVMAELVQQTKLIGQTDGHCKRMWGSYMYKDGMMCAYADNTSPCSGDSGGPLTMQDSSSGQHVLVGLVSFGEAVCTGLRPPMFTRVSYFLKWIDETIAAN